MELNLQGKTALVTGASYGLGFACAKALAQEGASVAICSRNLETVEKAAKEIADETGQLVFALQADLTNDDDLANLVSNAKAKLGSIDILVLSTGHPPTYSLAKATDEHWQEGNDLILRPTIQLTRELLPEMRQRKYGRFIYIGSVLGLQAKPSSIIQSTLRTGINAFSKCIATEAAIDGVTANVLCPGYFETPLLKTLAEKLESESDKDTADKLLAEWEESTPTKKFGKPEDFGAFVSFLASPRGEYFNGTSIAIDGGSLKRY